MTDQHTHRARKLPAVAAGLGIVGALGAVLSPTPAGAWTHNSKKCHWPTPQGG